MTERKNPKGSSSRGRAAAGTPDTSPHEKPGVRTPHGTRVARSIVCCECGTKDTVRFAPRDPTHVLCRRCAAQILGVADPDANIRPERTLTCVECKKTESTTFAKDDDYRCADCFRGIVSHQENRTATAERLSKGKVLRVRRSERED